MNKAATIVNKTANEVASRHARQARVAELDRLLEREPGAIEARYERAGLLRELGAFQEAKRDYLELLRCKPDDFGALNDFGTLVLEAGYGERRAFVVRGGSAASSRQANGPRQSRQSVVADGGARLGAGAFRRRACAPIPRTFTPIAAWAICWPSSVTRTARGAIATWDFRPLPHRAAVSRRRAAGEGPAADLRHGRQHADRLRCLMTAALRRLCWLWIMPIRRPAAAARHRLQRHRRRRYVQRQLLPRPPRSSRARPGLSSTSACCARNRAPRQCGAAARRAEPHRAAHGEGGPAVSCGSNGGGDCRRAGFGVSAARTRAGLSHRPAFRARRDGGGSCRGGRRLSGRRSMADRTA